MSEIWIISDTHFQHSNILNFTNADTGKLVRPEFSCAKEMDETIIQRWNEVIRPGDKVYHLGDVLFGNNKVEWMNTHWPRLMGKKRLIVGNHDNIKMLSAGGWFSKVEMWRRFDDFGLLLTHVPVHESSLLRKRHQTKELDYLTNVHGHIHEQNAPSARHVNVSVEKTDYRPVNIEEIRTR